MGNSYLGARVVPEQIQSKTEEKKIDKLDDTTVQQYLSAVDSLLAIADISAAAKLLNEAIKILPESPDLHYRLGVIAKVSFKNYQQAKEEFLLAIKYNPNDGAALFALAMSYKNDFQDYKNSKETFQTLLKLYPASGLAWKEFGDLLGYRLNDWNEAIKAYESSFQYKHVYKWNALNNCAWGLANKTKEYEKSEKYYKESISINPNNITYANLGRLYMDFLKRQDDAEKCFRESLKLEEKTSGAHVFLGQLLAQRVNNENALTEAKQHLLRALELNDERGKATLEQLIAREKQTLKQDDNKNAKDTTTDIDEKQTELLKQEFFNKTNEKTAFVLKKTKPCSKRLDSS